MIPFLSSRMSGLDRTGLPLLELNVQSAEPAGRGPSAASCSAKLVGTLAFPGCAPMPFQTVLVS